jgi:hypothetical protein
MIVLNDPQGALDYVWTWTISVDFTSTYTTGTNRPSAYVVPVHARCGVWWGNTNGQGINISVLGWHLPTPRLRFGPPGSRPFFGAMDRCTTTVVAPGINYTEVIILDNTTPKQLFTGCTITAEMDGAVLTGKCTASGFTATLKYNAIRIKRNGILLASSPAGQITNFPYDPRQNHFRMDPYTGPYDFDVNGGIPLPGGTLGDPNWSGANLLEQNQATEGRMVMIYTPPDGIIA